MKLLMISGDRSILQGKQSAFWYTLQEMRKHWDRIDVICPRAVNLPADGKPQRFDQAGGGEVFFHPNPRGLMSQVSWIKQRGLQVVKNEKPDVMTVHEYPPFFNGRGARWLAEETHLPYAIEIHHIVGMPIAASLGEWIGKKMSQRYLPKAAQHATSVRTVSSSVKKDLVAMGISETKVQIVSSFYLDHEMLTSAAQVPVVYDVAFCARLVANKGLEELLDAMSLMPTKRLIVIGDGPARAALEKRVRRLKLSGRVTFTGWLATREAVIQAMKSARVFVMNSKSEGGPRVLLEAMGCGLPVIATPVGVVTDVIEDGVNGFITNGHPRDLVRLILLLTADEKLRETVGNAARRILERYERNTLVTNYANYLKSLR